MSKNQYGLDHDYFERKIAILHRDGLRNWRSDELARELARMSRTADKSVILEPEFETQVELAALREELATAQRGLANCKLALDAQTHNYSVTNLRLTAAEQRNAELNGLLRELRNTAYTKGGISLAAYIDPHIKPTESGASE